MTYSSLVSKTIPHHGKYNDRAGVVVSRVIVHHWAGTSGGDVSLASPSRDASTNYILYSDGTLAVQVPEEYRAWTSGSYAADQPSITVEVQNSTNGPEWRVSDAAIAKLTALIADVARRYGWGSVTRSRVRGHREFAATACPGPYLWDRLGSIAANAHAQLGGKTPPPVNPTPPTTSVDALAQAVIRGEYGTGEERRRRLGARYAEVQARVNQLLGAAPAAPTPAPNVEQLAQAVIRGEYGTGDERRKRLGSSYAAVQARVNQILGASPAPVNPSQSIDALARAVIRGDYGNGEQRTARLGAQYAAVQARVNQILGA